MPGCPHASSGPGLSLLFPPPVPRPQPGPRPPPEPHTHPTWQPRARVATGTRQGRRAPAGLAHDSSALIYRKCDSITQSPRLALVGAGNGDIGSFMQDYPFITFPDSFMRLMFPPEGVIKQVKLYYFPPAANWREPPSLTDEARCLCQIGSA